MHPAMAANTNNVQFGACKRVHNNTSNNATPPISADTGKIRRCPKRSTSRDTCGAQNAVANANVAATAPAKP
ncbi:hypothetical protein D3C75_1362740 [compost metagenome]